MPRDAVSLESRQWLAPHIRGHVLLFDAKSPPTYAASAGARLLLIFVLLEGLIGPRLWFLSWLHVGLPPQWIRVPFLLGLAVILVRFFAGLRWSQLGLDPWSDWTTTERSYFVQVLVIANTVFPLLFANRLRAIVADRSLWWRASLVLITYFVWGFYQELVYRGILQTELVRRWGAVPGILITNMLFTLGPLHFYHFADAAPLPMFAAIFATGLFFGVLFRRSGNLWIVGILHGLGDCYFTGLGTL